MKKIKSEKSESENHIVGYFTIADLHWSAVFKCLEDQDQGSIFSSYANINSWLSKMKTEIPAYDTKAEKIAA